MRIPKRYGESRQEICPFCAKTAVVKNSQGIAVCTLHRDRSLPDMKCLCGSWLDIAEGKYGAYFRCINCGNISYSKGMEINEHLFKVAQNNAVEKKDKSITEEGQKRNEKKKRELTVTSADLDFMYN